MAKKRNTGAGDEYNGAEEEALAEAALDAYDGWSDDYEPDGIDVTAQIEWAGTVQPGNDGMRRTRIDGLSPSDMRAVREAVSEYRKGKTGQAEAKPLKSFTAKGWYAQLKALTESPYGSAAADRAGLDPSVRSVRRWLSAEATPNRENREKIDRAYAELRNRPVTEARERARGDAHKVAQALTRALANRYGPNVRFRNIRRFDFE